MNAVGPCLCGDPYCSFCGNPQAAEFDELIDTLVDHLQQLDQEEVQTFFKGGKQALARYQRQQKLPMWVQVVLDMGLLLTWLSALVMFLVAMWAFLGAR